jgi:apolipoprotein N-acyltransferase
MKRFTNLFAAIGCGLLLWAAWPASPFTLFIFVAWIPLLWLETRIKSKRRFFGFAYIALFIWNIATTWWIWNASLPGALGAFFANSLLMCFPWLGYKIVRNRFGDKWGYVSLVAFWMCFEYIHLHDWGLSWPWLTLGNVFASHPSWIQWYEYTGTSGGTLWILLANIFLFMHIKKNTLRDEGKSYKFLFAGVVVLIVPILFSLFFKDSATELPRNTSGILVVQPNIDPYEKIADGSFGEQLGKLINLTEQKMDPTTGLVVWPETALYTGSGIEEDNMRENAQLKPLWDFLLRHPRLTLFTGIESYRIYSSKQTTTARPAEDGSFYDSFNGSVMINSAGPLQFYHKSMLVPGVETLPWFLKFIDKWFEKFGGTTAGYARQEERTVLNDPEHEFKIAPAICYESIYGEYMSNYIRNGANLICIITNDGWWGNTPGYKQHMNYARLRAIETRRWVARSANTGISCFINPYGTLYQAQPWDKAVAIKQFIDTNTNKTFYVKNGDLLSRLMTGISIAFILLSLTLWIKRKFSRK